MSTDIEPEPTSSIPPDVPGAGDAGTKPNHKFSRAAKVGWGLWQQVAAVFAAFGLAALVGHFWEIGWRGALAMVVGVWDATVRPAVAWVLHVVLTVPLGWLGVHFEVSASLRDYLSVGLILLLSMERDRRQRRSTGLAAYSPFNRFGSYYQTTILMWPVYLLSLPLSISRLRREPPRTLLSVAAVVATVLMTSYVSHSERDQHLASLLAPGLVCLALAVFVAIWKKLRPSWRTVLPSNGGGIRDRYRRWFHNAVVYSSYLFYTLGSILFGIGLFSAFPSVEVPVMVASLLAFAALVLFLLVIASREAPGEVISAIRVLSPVTYLALLLAVNSWVMPG